VLSSKPEDKKENMFAKEQEIARKDFEQVFDVMQFSLGYC
jgi:hypothetical protein